MEAVCESGSSEACNGHAGEVECCVGHMAGQEVATSTAAMFPLQCSVQVGSTGQCTWQFTAGFGAVLECGRSDEVLHLHLLHLHLHLHCTGGDGPVLNRRGRRRPRRLPGQQRARHSLLRTRLPQIIHEPRIHLKRNQSIASFTVFQAEEEE